MMGAQKKQAGNAGNQVRIPATGCALCDEVAARTAVGESIHPLDEEACERHRKTCDRCRSLDAIGPGLLSDPAPATEKEIDAALRDMQRRARSSHRKKAILSAAMAAGLAVIAAALAWTYVRRTPRSNDRPTGPSHRALSLESGCLISAGSPRCMAENAPLSDAAVVTAASTQVRLRDGRGLRLAALLNTKISIRSQVDAVTIHLLEGSLAVSLSPNRKLDLAIKTDRATVRVTGTMFSVRSDRRDTVVAVAAGHVEVSVASRNDRILLGPGETLSVSKMTRQARIDEATTDLLRALAETSGRPYRLPESNTQTPGSPKETGAAPAGGGTGSIAYSRPGGDRKVPGRRTREKGPHARPSGHPSPSASAVPAPSLNNNLALLRKAQACRRAGNWTCALATYQFLAEGRGGSPVTSALVAMAQIELDKLHRPAAALQHFSAYLKKRPNGALAAEALYGKARALRALGRSNKERQALKRFLENFPNSIRAARARKRLDVLERTR